MKLLIHPPEGIVIGRVCLLVRLFVRYSRCVFSKSTVQTLESWRPPEVPPPGPLPPHPRGLTEALQREDSEFSYTV